MLSKAAVEGKLSTRADGSKHAGDYRKIVERRERDTRRRDWTVQEAGAVLRRSRRANLTAKVTARYQGDPRDIKNDINAMTEALCSSMASIAVNAQSLASSSERVERNQSATVRKCGGDCHTG